MPTSTLNTRPAFRATCAGISSTTYNPRPSTRCPAARRISSRRARVRRLLRRYPADLAVLGLGENGHLAFNDPPYALFDDPAWVKLVRLAEVSRRQQVGEGHFASLAEVPTHAITLTIPALLAAAHPGDCSRSAQGQRRCALSSPNR